MRMICLALFAAAAQGSPAAGQDGAAMDMTGMGIYAMEDSMMESARDTVDRTTRRAAPSRQVSAADLAYRPSVAERRKNLDRFVARMQSRSPAGAAEVERLFASTDVIGEMGKAIAPMGLRTDNVADAFTMWWINAWLASRGRDDDPSRAQIAAVRRQAVETIAMNPQFAGASNAVKQEFAEANIVQAALIAGTMQGAKGNAAQKRDIAAQVRKGARASGMDLDAIELTDAGFVPAR